MQKSILLFVLSCVLLPPASAGQAVSPRLPSNLAYIGNVNKHPEKNVCRSGEYENPATHDPYWISQGVTVFSDGSEEVHSLYMGIFRTAKEKRKQRRKALTSCADWLDKSGN